MIIGLVHVIIVTVTVMFIVLLNCVHCEITACDSDNKQSQKSYLILSYLILEC